MHGIPCPSVRPSHMKPNIYSSTQSKRTWSINRGFLFINSSSASCLRRRGKRNPVLEGYSMNGFRKKAVRTLRRQMREILPNDGWLVSLLAWGCRVRETI